MAAMVPTMVRHLVPETVVAEVEGLEEVVVGMAEVVVPVVVAMAGAEIWWRL